MIWKKDCGGLLEKEVASGSDDARQGCFDILILMRSAGRGDALGCREGFGIVQVYMWNTFAIKLR